MVSLATPSVEVILHLVISDVEGRMMLNIKTDFHHFKSQG